MRRKERKIAEIKEELGKGTKKEGIRIGGMRGRRM
jgi:hypothetical protein